MRLWTRIRRVSSQAFSNMSSRIVSKVDWHRLGRRRFAPPDPDVGLIHELVAKGTPMSLASLKAALDATACVQDAKRPGASGMKSLGLAAIGSAFTIFV